MQARNADRPFRTVYIGGGTPSSLNETQLRRLLAILKRPLSGAKEATIEANPEQLDEKKIQLMKEGGINRLSLGVQTFDETILSILAASIRSVKSPRPLPAVMRSV